MSFFQQAARLNNDGVAALLKGDSKSAIQSMANSIKMMKQELAKPTSTDLSNLKDNDFDIVEIPQSDNSSEDVIVFNHSINIPYEGEHTELDIQLYTAAVIFNLALAHQHQALKGETSLYMAKAEKLYSMVLKLIDDDAVCHLRTAVIVKLAAINNLAQIRFANADFEHAHEAVNLLMAFMRKANQRLLEEPQVQGLVMNVLLLKAPRVAPAA